MSLAAAYLHIKLFLIWGFYCFEFCVDIFLKKLCFYTQYTLILLILQCPFPVLHTPLVATVPNLGTTGLLRSFSLLKDWYFFWRTLDQGLWRIWKKGTILCLYKTKFRWQRSRSSDKQVMLSRQKTRHALSWAFLPAAIRLHCSRTGPPLQAE